MPLKLGAITFRDGVTMTYQQIEDQRANSQTSRGNPVVLVPGYTDDASIFSRLVTFLAEENFQPYPISLVPSDGRVGLDVLAGQIADFVGRRFAEDQPLDFVGFSMGGVVLRYYLQRLGGLARTQHFVTLGTPHRGTWTSYANNRPGVRQMRPGSGLLRDLNSDVDRLDQVCFTSIWTPLDLMILPAASSRLAAARNEAVFALHHRALLTSRRSLARVAEALRRPLHQT